MTNNNTLVKFSKIISDFFNPLTALIIYFLYLSSKNYSWSESVNRFLPILIIVIIPIVVWLVWNVKTGRYSNMDVSNRNQRKTLYFFIEGALAVYLLFHYVKTGNIDLVMLFLLVLLAVMQISNYFIKSSMHTSFNVFTAALFFSQDERLGIGWLLISMLVGATRIILKRHTPREVFVGFSIATIISFIYLYTNIQANQ